MSNENMSNPKDSELEENQASPFFRQAIFAINTPGSVTDQLETEFGPRSYPNIDCWCCWNIVHEERCLGAGSMGTVNGEKKPNQEFKNEIRGVCTLASLLPTRECDVESIWPQGQASDSACR
jgi:hypothetical protein